MNIHLPAILGFTRCQGFDPFAIFFHHFCPPNVQKGRQWFERQIAGALGAAAPLAPWSAHGSGGGGECLGWKRAGNAPETECFFFHVFPKGFHEERLRVGWIFHDFHRFYPKMMGNMVDFTWFYHDFLELTWWIESETMWKFDEFQGMAIGIAESSGNFSRSLRRLQRLVPFKCSLLSGDTVPAKRMAAVEGLTPWRKGDFWAENWVVFGWENRGFEWEKC